MDLLKKYAESSASDEEPVKEATKVQKTMHIGSLAPEVDITDLQLVKQQQEMTRFARETKIETKQNHLTGFLQEA
jgi:hypothetical protein